MLRDNDDDDGDSGGDDGDGDCSVVRRRRTIPNRMNSFSFAFLGRIEGLEKLGDMQANGKNVAGITVSTTQCLYVVR